MRKLPGQFGFRREGQVLVITLLAMTMLVGLVFYVYNLGFQVNRRLSVQNAADAAAISGAGWMARGMNVLAMDNMAESRLLALVAVLDSIPLAAEMTIAEETGKNSLTQGLQDQLNRGVPATSYERDNFLRVGLQNMLNQMGPNANSTQYDALVALHNAFSTDDERQKEAGAYDMRRATGWPNGELWQAIRALDNLSQATFEGAGTLAQSNAGLFGTSDSAQSALLVPVLPKVPAQQEGFINFQTLLTDALKVTGDKSDPDYPAALKKSNLVSQLQASADVLVTIEQLGISGGAIPDWMYPYRLGPFAELYKWRSWYAVGGVAFGNADGLSQRTQQGGAGGKTVGYTTYGPVQWAEQTATSLFGLAGSNLGDVDTSRMAHHMNRLTNLKLAYMFGLQSPQQVQYSDQWVTDYPTAKSMAADPTKAKTILRTRYYNPVVRSKISWNDQGNWMRDTSTYSHALVQPLNNPPSALWPWEPWGWYDVASSIPAHQFIQHDFDNDGVVDETEEIWNDKVGDYVWRVREEITYLTYVVGNSPAGPVMWSGDPELGLFPIYDKNGKPIPTKEWVVGWYVFGGVEIRDPVQVSDPCEGHSLSDVPTPFLVDTSNGDYDPNNPTAHDEGARRNQFTLLGTATQTNEAAVWPQKFVNANPSHSMLAVAQAELFNNTSWDLWTQDWQARLVPTTQYDAWAAELQTGIAAGDGAGVVPDDQLKAVYDYLSRLSSDMAGRYSIH